MNPNFQSNSVTQYLRNPKIVAGLLILVALFLGIFLFFSTRSTPGDNQPTAQDPSNDTSIPPSQEQQVSIYSDDVFMFDYPDNWTVTVNLLEGNQGQSIMFMPDSLPEGETVPAFIVSYDLDPTSIEERIRTLEQMGLQRGTILVNNMAFLKASGTSIDRVVNDELVEDPMQVTYAFARINEYTVLIKYLYDGNQVKQEDETFFRSFIENVTFHSRGQ